MPVHPARQRRPACVSAARLVIPLRRRRRRGLTCSAALFTSFVHSARTDGGLHRRSAGGRWSWSRTFFVHTDVARGEGEGVVTRCSCSWATTGRRKVCDDGAEYEPSSACVREACDGALVVSPSSICPAAARIRVSRAPAAVETCRRHTLLNGTGGASPGNTSCALRAEGQFGGRAQAPYISVEEQDVDGSGCDGIEE